MRSQQTLGRRQRPSELLVLRAGHAQGSREGLEYRLDLVVTRTAVEHLHVDVGARPLREALEEVLHQLCLQIPDEARLHAQVDDRVRASGEIDRGDGERLVHRHHEIAGAIEPSARPERRRHGFAERDAHVLDGVMLIDVEISSRLQRQVERAMTSEEFQHVVEKANAGRDIVAPASFERQLQADRRFAGVALDYRAAHTTSSSAAMARCVSSTIPAVMRMQPSHPISAERSRTITPRAARARTMSGAAGPTRARMKLAVLGHVSICSRAHASASSALDSPACAQYHAWYSRSLRATGSAAAAHAFRL